MSRFGEEEEERRWKEAECEERGEKDRRAGRETQEGAGGPHSLVATWCRVRKVPLFHTETYRVTGAWVSAGGDGRGRGLQPHFLPLSSERLPEQDLIS